MHTRFLSSRFQGSRRLSTRFLLITVTCLLGLGGFLASGIGGPGNDIQVLSASFDHEQDGDGENWADLGYLTGFTQSGKPFSEVSAASGFRNGAFTLVRDREHDERFGLGGVFEIPIEPGRTRTWFTVRPEQRDGSIEFDWRDDRGVDILGMTMGENGKLKVGDSPWMPAYRANQTYLVGQEIQITDDFEVTWSLIVVDLNTQKTLGLWEGGFHSAEFALIGAVWSIPQGKDGTFHIDEIRTWYTPEHHDF